jgi:hypothetical protein
MKNTDIYYYGIKLKKNDEIGFFHEYFRVSDLTRQGYKWYKLNLLGIEM